MFIYPLCLTASEELKRSFTWKEALKGSCREDKAK